MLSHKYRFHGHGSLRYLYRNGRSARNRSLLIRYTPNKHRLHSRAAVIVSKKVMKSAVGRNRIRRRIYEVLRQDWSRLKPGMDLSITVFSADFAVLPSAQLERQLREVLKQADLYEKAEQPGTIED